MRSRERTRGWMSILLVVLMGLVGVAPGLAQQSGTGTLTGTVQDNAGVVPGATVVVTEVATGAARTTTTSDVGVFRVPALPPGRYTLRVDVEGFRPMVMTDIQLLTTEVRDLGRLTLQVGQQTESVTVTAEVTPVQVATSSRYSTVTSDQLTNIQMKGRDVYGLLSILPGVQDTNLNRDFSTWTSMRDVTINGSPVVNKNIVVDGISVVDEGGAGNAFVNPNIDAVGEVQVVANGFTAENGRNNGGLIMMTTKSGTNTFRGSGWYNARREAWNSNDYFRKIQNQPKPLYRVNISGYSVGGPIIIPGLYNSRTSSFKAYFFASQEYTDDARPQTITRSNLPTDPERNGDFSQTRITNGTIQPIIDPNTGTQFAGNLIPQNRINPLGQAMLNLVPGPNGVLNPQAGQEWTSNSAYEGDPTHSRTNHVLRLDAVINQGNRGSFKFMRDREDNWFGNAFAPGLGRLNNFVPGWIYSGSFSSVVTPTMVNEITFGFGHNNYGFKGNYDYTQYYRQNLGVDPPRLEPFGEYADPPVIGKRQADEYPYFPIASYGGGNRTNLATYSPGANTGRVMPSANRNDRWSFQNDLSYTRGRHNFKFGLYTEYTIKTEPGSTNYMGNFDFGHNADNPLSSGNGYANALLGVYTTYTELSRRIDSDRRHWQTDAYAQDSWRLNSRFTLDYGMRFTHSGAFFEVNDMTSGFFPNDWTAGQAARIYTPVCSNGAAGNGACPAANRRAIDPLNPTVFLPLAYQGNLVPGSGSQLNGVRTGGVPGLKTGQYYTHPGLVAAPRVGFAWDVFGDGSTAVRGSAGVFYNYPRGGFTFVGGNAVASSRVIRWGRFSDIENAQSVGVQFVESPISGSVAGGERNLERSYNFNLAVQRDIGFNTVIEAAWVRNYADIQGRTVDINRGALYAYGNPANLFNAGPKGADFLRTRYPGMSTINEFVNDLYPETLRYNALQLSAQRRLSNGLQMGLAYTIAKGEGYQGYDPYTDEVGGAAAIRQRYWSATDVDRRHNLVINYSYNIPNPMPSSSVVGALLKDWQVSGVTKFLTGTVVNPACTSNNSGIASSNPALTPGITARCQMTGEPVNANSGDRDNPDVPHFNLAAFAMPTPNGATGNFGDMPLGLLRNPSWSNWDLTIARRFAIPLGRDTSARIQFQLYNIFNQVEFINLDAAFQFTGANNSVLNSANTGKYTVASGAQYGYGTTPPRQLGITTRIDF